MADNELQQDPDALEAWRKLPQSQPSKQALPPATQGFPNWLWGLIAFGALIVILALVGQAI